MGIIMEGKTVSSAIKDQVKKEVEDIKTKYGKTPKLTVILCGDDPASQIYVKNKEKACAALKIDSEVIRFDHNTPEEEIKKTVEALAKDEKVNGILVQLPLPKEINERNIIELIPPEKDVDGLTSLNVAQLIRGEEGIVPCTPLGITDMLDYYGISLEGKRVSMVGRSMLVGKPLFNLLTNRNATVTLCHSKTRDLKEETLLSDIVIMAIGKPLFLKEDMIKDGAIVIDVGINRIDGRIYGDADFENLKNKASYITPVPGGCGLMTVAELLKNTIKCFYLQHKK